MSGGRPPRSEALLLLARGKEARRLVQAGELLAADALALTVWPTEQVREVEDRVPTATLASRAYGMRVNP